MQLYECENTGCDSFELDTGSELARFSVLYTKLSTRKHKKWEGDGVLICYSNLVLLKSEDEKDIISRSTSLKRHNDLVEGQEIKMGVWEVQIQERITARKLADKTQQAVGNLTSLKRSTTASPSFEQPKAKILACELTSVKTEEFHKRPSRQQFRCPLVECLVPENGPPPFIINENRVREFGEEPVVGDKFICRHLRDHQKDGVRFLFSHLQEERGVILADEMGLGKSIQTIVATLALLRQPKNTNRYIPKKCLLVVPSSLVDNWKSEFQKWFPSCRSLVITVNNVSDIISYSCSYLSFPYLIISYDMALRYVERLATIRFDILVCDEGHRLKNMSSKLRQALDSLAITRRLLLTGTPLQNEIEEFYSLLDFVRPTWFGSVAEFKLKCREENEELNAIIADSMLRRTADVNSIHLPVKNEYILFCAPSAVQKSVIGGICAHMLGEPLVLIDMMRKTANHPAILYKKLSDNATKNTHIDYSSLMSAFPKDYGDRPASLADSGKLSVFLEMMASFRQYGECVLVVSNYTKTLDMLASLCSSLGLRVMRLDGQTPVSDRQFLVTKFNAERDPRNVFLLSTKAGGVGLNLIGASRLILFDSDWNPALDLQAMARIWRDGQTKPCHIYRLVTAGTIDEKILQRQIKKTGLSSIINFSEQSSKNAFIDEELEDIFTLSEAQCETHDLLGCQCDGSGLLPAEMEEDEQGLETADEVKCSKLVGQEGSENFDEGDELIKQNEEVTQELQEEPATMAELLRWRHYSPNHQKAWDYFKSVAGFDNTLPNDLTFAFHLSSRF